MHSGKVTPLSQSDGTPIDPVAELAWSPDGTSVAFASSDPSLPNEGSIYANMYIEDLSTNEITLVSAPDNPRPGEEGADGPSYTPAWSPNGRYLAFNSTASNLIASAHVGNLQEEVYVYDAEAGKLSLASAAPGGPPADGPNYETFIADGDNAYAFPVYEHWAWSPNSTKLLFASAADNLVAGNLTNQEQIYAKTLATGDLQIVSATVSETPGDSRSGGWAEWSPEGTKVIFDSEAGNLGAPMGSVLVKDMVSKALSLVGVGGTGCGCGTASMWSPDGEWVSFLGQLGEGLLAKNILTGPPVQIAPLNTPEPPSLESPPAWSPDGTRIAFEINEANLLPGVGGDQIYIRRVSEKAVSVTVPPPVATTPPSSAPPTNTPKSTTRPCAPVHGSIGKRLLASLKCKAAKAILGAKCSFAVASILFLSLKTLHIVEVAKGIDVLSKVPKKLYPVAKLFYDLSHDKYLPKAPAGYRSFAEVYKKVEHVQKAIGIIKLIPALYKALSKSDFNQLALDLDNVLGLHPCVQGLANLVAK